MISLHTLPMFRAWFDIYSTYSTKLPVPKISNSRTYRYPTKSSPNTASENGEWMNHANFKSTFSIFCFYFFNSTKVLAQRAIWWKNSPVSNSYPSNSLAYKQIIELFHFLNNSLTLLELKRSFPYME